MPKQVIQHCKGFGSELYGLLALPQAFVSQVQAKGVEGDAFFVRHYAPTLQKFYGRIMRLNAMQKYSPFFMEGSQYKATFDYSVSGRRPRLSRSDSRAGLGT